MKISKPQPMNSRTTVFCWLIWCSQVYIICFGGGGPTKNTPHHRRRHTTSKARVATHISHRQESAHLQSQKARITLAMPVRSRAPEERPKSPRRGWRGPLVMNSFHLYNFRLLSVPIWRLWHWRRRQNCGPNKQDCVNTSAQKTTDSSCDW